MIKSITINDQVLSGNLVTESGYDDHASGDKYAELLEQQLTSELQSRYPGVAIVVNVKCEYASGACREADIYVEDEDGEMLYGDEAGEDSIRDCIERIGSKIYQDQMEKWLVEEPDIALKTCPDCGREMERDEALYRVYRDRYRDDKNPTGHLYVCKECYKG